MATEHLGLTDVFEDGVTLYEGDEIAFLHKATDQQLNGALRLHGSGVRAEIVGAQLAEQSFLVTAGAGLSINIAPGVGDAYDSTYGAVYLCSLIQLTLTGLTPNRGAGAPIYIYLGIEVASPAFNPNVNDSRATAIPFPFASDFPSEDGAVRIASVTTGPTSVLTVTDLRFLNNPLSVRSYNGVSTAWNTNLTYRFNEIVTSGGKVWRALRQNIGVTPVAGADWELFGLVASGSGSGLDADTLDGHDSPYFATDADLDAHAAETAPHSATSNATASRLVLRDPSGRAKVADGAAAGDIVNLGQVQAMFRATDMQPSVLDKDLATPPGSPATGARYIVASGATGAWSGHVNEIAEWSGSAWVFSTPNEGFFTRVEDENVYYAFDGSAWSIYKPPIAEADLPPSVVLDNENITVDDTLASPASTGTLGQLLSWIAGRIKGITGKSSWLTAPATTLEAAATHIAAAAPHSGHALDSAVVHNTGTENVNGAKTFLQETTFSEYIAQASSTATQFTSNVNDYTPGDYGVLRLSSDAARDVTGFAGEVSGRFLLVINVGSFNITLKHQSASSTAARRIIGRGGADVILAPDDAALLRYDSTTSRWRVLHGVEALLYAANAFAQRQSLNGGADLTSGNTSDATAPDFLLTKNSFFCIVHHRAHSDTAGHAPLWSFRRSRGSAAAPTAVSNGDGCGALQWLAYANGAYQFLAQITGAVNGTVSGSTVPLDLIFQAGSPTIGEVMRIDSAQKIAIGVGGAAVISGTGKLDMAADTVRLRTARTPASAGAAGNAGEICWDSGFLYICVATNTWKRVAVATW